MVGQPPFATIMITIGLLVRARPADPDDLGLRLAQPRRPLGIDTVGVAG